MAYSTNKFSVVKKKKLESSTFAVECNVGSEIEIEKVLSVTYSAQADTAEILNGTVNFTGSIDLCVLFMSVDGEIGTINSTCPFTSKFEDDIICVGDKVGIDMQIEDYAIESVTGTNIKLSVSLRQNGVVIMVRDVDNAVCDDENICKRDDELLVNTLVGQASDSFSVESQFAIKEPVRKVLLSDSNVCVKNVESGVNFVSVSGEVITRLLYLTENDRFETSYVTENFKEEVELEGVTREALSDATACIRKNSVTCQIEEAEKGVNVKVTIPVELRVESYLEISQPVIKDLYSVCNELQVTTASFEMSKTSLCDQFEQKIDGTLTLDDDKPRVDKIMFVGGSNLNVTNSYIKGDELFVEGVAKTNVVYLNDETNSLNSAVVEVPFVISDKTELNETCENSVSVVLTDVDVAVKKGREFLFDAKLKVNVQYFECKTGAVISAIENGETLPERDCAIELVFASAGQTAWDIGKQIFVKEETITFQNPELSFPLENDESIVVFHKLR